MNWNALPKERFFFFNSEFIIHAVHFKFSSILNINLKKFKIHYLDCKFVIIQKLDDRVCSPNVLDS